MAPPGPPGPPQGPPPPLPRGPFTAIVLMYLSNSLSMTILFPFVAYMVESFHVTDDVAKLGYYAGLLGSAAFLGAFISNTFWGVLSDRIGRKPVLLLGLLANILGPIAFGLSSNLYMAVAARFVNGLFSTVGPTARTSVAELCDRSNMAKGFSVLGTMFGVGFLLGPAIGGFLCEPSEKYPALFPPGSIFDTFPYLLPCLVLAVFSLVGLLATIYYLPETLHKGQKGPRGPGGGGPWEGPSGAPDETKAASNAGSLQGREGSFQEGREPLLTRQEKGQGHGDGGGREQTSWEKTKEILLKRNTVVATMLLAVITFVSAAFSEVFPIWCLTPWELGGLSWGTNLVGLAQTASGVALIPLQLYAYAPLVDKIGPVSALRWAVGFGAVVFFFPVARVFGQGSTGLVVAVCALQALRSIPQCVYTSVYMLIAKSVKNPKDMGFVNGASQSMSVLFMAMAPESSASFFAWVTGVNGLFLTSSLWFVVIVLLYLSMIGLTFLLEPPPVPSR